MAKHRELLLGFGVRISPPRGMTPADEFFAQWALELHLCERGLQADGGPLAAVIRSGDRSLTAVDQVDLVTWLFFEVGVPTVALGPLCSDGGPPEGDGPALRVSRADPALAPLAVLYREHRIDAAQFLDVLGGYMRPSIH